jgi:hypothetical protein
MTKNYNSGIEERANPSKNLITLSKRKRKVVKLKKHWRKI